ncbi:pyridoxamine 5'-phosphate oxidase family protein [Streptomyces sp. GC420]|uniref:pyridoxamine 5'-phosphate oxidase family protein n=1 Tax=Streptomyces sp. GC420 TaxID=2697568 RepID=UPI0014150FB3|nr:pyridoxamine 5'-phosphate oxidase family protein [Streptomyces sp. GC420]NBM21138.1 pyridoxamine 5'-phosphate oxidase family protein [Streptomyces sp. GC420]
MHPYDGFRELGREEALALMAGVPIGRIVYTDGALPAVLPVNFSLDDDSSVVLRTAKTSRMARAVDRAVVAFEADQFDESARTGWSVVVTGLAGAVSDEREQERLRRTGPRSWAPTPDGIYIRITPELVTGRVLGESRAAAANGHAAPEAEPV